MKCKKITFAYIIWNIVQQFLRATWYILWLRSAMYFGVNMAEFIAWCLELLSIFTMPHMYQRSPGLEAQCVWSQTVYICTGWRSIEANWWNLTRSHTSFDWSVILGFTYTSKRLHSGICRASLCPVKVNPEMAYNFHNITFTFLTGS